jgi:enamine deaminase RidA (YjgF/YER057c/UK114 family)
MIPQPANAPSILNKREINPWQWQDTMGFNQAIEVTHATRTLYCSGQAAMNEDGHPNAASMEEQLVSSLHNLETVLSKAGYQLSDIVRLNYYTTSIEEFFAAYGAIAQRLSQNHCKPSSTLVEVKALAHPQLKIEIEATAVK